MAESRIFPIAYFIVLCPLSTTWSTKTMPPTDSQVIIPFMQAFLFPASLGRRHHLCTFELNSFLGCVLHYSIGWSHNHDRRVIACAKIVGGPARSNSFPCVLAWSIWGSPIFIFSISSSSLVLFLLSLAPLFSSSWSLRLPHQMASCNC